MSSNAAASRRLSSATTATAKRPAMAESAGGAKLVDPVAVQQAKKRVALGNITNIAAGAMGRTGCGKVAVATPGNARLHSTTSAAPVKKGSLASVQNAIANRSLAVKSASTRPTPKAEDIVPPPKVPTVMPIAASAIVPCCSFASPQHSEDSISTDETMSTSDSMKSPDLEYIDNGDSLVLDSLQQRANANLRISEESDVEGTKWKKDATTPMEIDNISDVDDNYKDPQLCATLPSDIYMHLRDTETRKRPASDFLETMQKDINPSMRAILIDWLVEVSEEYRLVPDTLYLTVNYIDRYLSGNEINRQRLQLLGVACMLIAAKHEEICAPQVEEFCYITDNTYFKDEVLEMEASVINYLKFEMTAPTAKCFLRRFVRAAQVCDEDPALHLESLACYVTELSLLEYSLLVYPPSLVAASALFLSKFILQPTKSPWNSTLAHYTQYKASELCDCVKELQRLFCVAPGSKLPAIREKYSQHKYKFAAKKQCPPMVPADYFCDAAC
ncbi:cyclin-A1-1-like [Brachypodium distachyon]|uniref:cyclin-A1-1-like n=1 Tax=Brachypodium distachyon TaxID=15368 RepID=UPI000234E033|nr:cyclin-A1-1-like [Brachypodium distachyon]|eukprot:XP_003566081.1 cyclin-A1-1-like [Brachypodium distachyon]